MNSRWIAAFCCGLIALPLLAQTAKPSPQPARDFRKLSRIFTLGEAPPGGNVYTGPRTAGQRLFLSADASANLDNRLINILGISLLQSETDPLSTPESADGVWEWRAHNAERQAATKAGRDWGLYLHAAFPPAWYRQKFEFTRLECLEHRLTVDAYSPWSPGYAKFIDRVWAGARKQYPNLPVVTVGIHGDYGEAGLMTGQRLQSREQRADWVRRFGNDHNHIGFWCGDDDAEANFRRTMLRAYGTVQALNQAWLTNYEKPEDIEFPVAPQTSYQARLDFVGWYKNGVTSLADTTLKIARRNYPNSVLMLPVGAPDESVRLGHDVSALAKVAGRYNAQLRSTNGGFRPFDQNHAITLGQVRAVSRFYNVPLWLASSAPSDALGFSQRLFEALSSGAVGYFDWTENWRRHVDAAERSQRLLNRAEPVVEIACLFPTSNHELRPQQTFPPLMLEGMRILRDYADFDVVDERLVQEGALHRYKIAVMWEGVVWRKETLDKLRDWVSSGGILLAYDFGKFTTPTGDLDHFNSLFGYAGSLRYQGRGPEREWARPYGRGWTVYFPAQRRELPRYVDLVRAVAYTGFPAATEEPRIAKVDDEPDGVYATLATDRVIFFNSSRVEVTKTVQLPGAAAQTVTVAPESIAVLPIGEGRQEMLLQAEKFVELGGQPLIASKFCSPGTGQTAVNVAPGKSILTRVQVPQAGPYRLFVRALVKNQLAPVRVSVNGQVVAGTPKRVAGGDVFDYGTVTLGEGVQEISMANGTSFVADFVLLTNDPNIRGYRFPTVR